MNPHIIGLTGSFGSGCSYIAKNILATQGYEILSLSEVLKDLFTKKTDKKPEDVPRCELQQFGDHIRETKEPGHLADAILKVITDVHKKDSNKKFVVDSIRNPVEIEVFRDHSRNFFLFGIYADRDVRWERVKDTYQNNKGEFEKDDSNDTGNNNKLFGQRVADCFNEADVVFENYRDFAVPNNEEFNEFKGFIDKYIGLVANPLNRQRPIRPEEALMTMAYAVSQRSSCLKRKVGAIIVDSTGDVISSGFNEVPGNERPCEKEYNDCYRKKTFIDFFEELSSRVPEANLDKTEIAHMFQQKFKILDYCRSLHAEENAIINLARDGSSVPLKECTLYSTTYPCRMCANKIVQAGIKNVVYLEPYPDEQAKLILQKARVKDTAFKGVTSKAYFRLYGEQR